MQHHINVGILVVNGGIDPSQERWIVFCLRRILEITRQPNYHIYLWNNNVDDKYVEHFCKNKNKISLIQADRNERLEHPHACALERLLRIAEKDGCNYIVTIDSDTFPLDPSWLEQLIRALHGNVVLSGIWRDELSKAITPYIHPSCLATTIDFIRLHNIRFDFIAPNTQNEIHDTLSVLTETAQRYNYETFKLVRSNKKNIHRLIGGIYGGIVYHHGAGSRNNISFWDEPLTAFSSHINRCVARTSAALLIEHTDSYLAWLTGEQKISWKVSTTAQYLRALNVAGIYFSTLNCTLRQLLNKIKRKLGRTNSSTEQRDKTPIKQLCRPIKLRDLPPTPPGWKVKAPDFVGIGAPKAGTTWWNALIFEHPDIYQHRFFDTNNIHDTKEISFFPHFGYQGMREHDIQSYKNMFAAPEGGLCGEWSVLYLSHPLCLNNLRTCAPEAKIIILLRNPVDRTISHLNQLSSHRFKTLEADETWQYVLATFSAYPEAILHSLYSHGLETLLRLYPREKILVLQYEKCRQNPLEEIKKTYEFLGVRRDVVPIQLERRINEKPYLVEKPDPVQRRWLAEYFASDVERVVKMIPEIDLELWDDFCEKWR
ncbi:sulfotransferase domain-containing protein [Methylococcus sp. Mc7]|uniref:sulfotransferase domain-containing protein n=1 Tax=Methylococcus sp. Mc7 TaxID=2860258 RepID=UPI001C52F683|nr:sulfotransferase domain-containing protein [Methylococcus sp. Mc7]QXP84577.1 sulfotransferase domain-containing protein [Methylococcus sp. Mc7]